MFDSQTISVQGNGTSATTSFYSPWFSRGGDYGLFTLEVTKFSESTSTLSVAVDIAQKNSDDPGNGTDMGLTGFSIAGDATGASLRTTKDVTNGFKELVRYKFTISITSSTSGRTYWAAFRMLSPVWYDKV